MKPLLVFQLPMEMSDEEKYSTANAIRTGIEKGALILDSRVTILSYDKDGNLDYHTPQEDRRMIWRKPNEQK